MLEVFESEALDLCTCTTRFRIPSAPARAFHGRPAASSLHHHASRHGHHPRRSNRSYLPITKFSIEQSDGVTSISHYLLKETLKDFDIKRPIEVIPNFVNCDLYNRIADKVSARNGLPAASLS